MTQNEALLYPLAVFNRNEHGPDLVNETSDDNYYVLHNDRTVFRLACSLEGPTDGRKEHPSRASILGSRGVCRIV